MQTLMQMIEYDKNSFAKKVKNILHLGTSFYVTQVPVVI